MFDQIFGQFFDQGFWIRKYNVQVYGDGEIQCTGLPGQTITEIQGKPKTNQEKCFFLKGNFIKKGGFLTGGRDY